MAFHQHSVDDIVIVGQADGNSLADRLGSGEKYGVRLQYVENKDWEKGIGTSLNAAKEVLEGEDRFLLSMADHWYEPKIIGEVLNDSSLDSVLCVDKNTLDYQDIAEATKIYVEDSLIREIGKDLRRYNAVDCGVFILTEEVFDALQESFRHGDYSLTGAIRVLTTRGRMAANVIRGSLWQDIDTQADLGSAERKLFSTLKSEGDGVVARHLNRHLSVPITRAIARYDVSPNLITIVSFLISITVGLLFFSGSMLSVVIAGILTQLASVVDGVDGELARLKFRSTTYGSYMDSILDRYGDAIMIMGMAYYSYSSTPEIWVILVASLAVLGSGMSMMSRDAYFRSFGARYIPTRMDRAARFLLAGRDGRLFIIFLGAISNQVLIAMIVLAVTTNLLAIIRLIIVRLNASVGPT